jgi:sugar phosphate isomerase/epimerase
MSHVNELLPSINVDGSLDMTMGFSEQHAEQQLSPVFEAGFTSFDMDFGVFGSKERPSVFYTGRQNEFAQEIASIAVKNNARISQCHCPILGSVEIINSKPEIILNNAQEKALEDVFRVANIWRTPAVVIHPFGLEDNWTDDLINDYFIANHRHLTKCICLAKKYKTRIAIENMSKSRYYCVNPADLIQLVDSLDRVYAGICLDTGHALMAGYQPEKLVAQFDNRIIALHIQDGNGFTDQHNLPPFGDVNWPSFMQALQEIRYQGSLSFEINGNYVRKMSEKTQLAFYNYAYQYAQEMLAMISSDCAQA